MTNMNMKFERKLPTGDEIKTQFPLSSALTEQKKVRDKLISDIFTGKSDKFILIIGPCSADCTDSVMDYMHRLSRVQERVKDKIVII